MLMSMTIAGSESNNSWRRSVWVFLISVSFGFYGFCAELQEQFVWVAALERDSTAEASNDWNPTLYQIDVSGFKIVKSLRLAESGAPVRCFSGSESEVVVVIKEGIAANGTFVSYETTKEVRVDRTTMQIIRVDVVGNDIEYQTAMATGFESTKSRSLLNRDGQVYLGRTPDDDISYLLTSATMDTRENRDLLLAESATGQTVKTIPLNPQRQPLGPFMGKRLGNADLLGHQYLILLFYGESSLGFFESGNVVIADLKEGQSHSIAIGSNPAYGIAH